MASYKTLIFYPASNEKKLYIVEDIEGITRDEIALGLPYNILEVSSQSTTRVGQRLSALNLKYPYRDEFLSVENCYQGSKVFQNGGPYRDLLSQNPFMIKKDTRLYTSGRVIGFEFENKRWEGSDSSYFYDWLYIGALYRSRDLMTAIMRYEGFVDRFFNPKYSRVTQACSCAIARSLIELDELDYAMVNPDCFIETLKRYQ